MKRTIGFIVTVGMVLLLLVSCASSTIPITVTRLPTMNTTGLQRIAIMPFETSENNALQAEIAGVITTSATSKIKATNQFTLVDPTEIQRLQSNGESIENYVDALFTGQIVSLIANDSSHSEERRVYSGKSYRTVIVTVYDREVELVFSYNFKRARDGSLIGVVTKRGKNSDHNEERSSLKSNSQMLQAIVTNRLQKLAQDVAPYKATEERSLAEDTSGNSAVKKQMGEILNLVKEGSYKQALTSYNSIYEQYGSFAAAYNAAILTEALGDIDGAVSIIQRLTDDTGNPKASAELARLQKVQADLETLTEYSDTDGHVDKIIRFAVENAAGQLPKGAKVAVVNNSNTERSLADYVVNGITAAIGGRGVPLVDRENLNLTQGEKDYQMTGNVSDDDFVGIGNEAGVNTFVLVSISGSSNMRKLHIRILDVATNKVIYQSPQDNDWNI
jgi:tetratricopeptide (TPR) repeat protein